MPQIGAAWVSTSWVSTGGWAEDSWGVPSQRPAGDIGPPWDDTAWMDGSWVSGAWGTPAPEPEAEQPASGGGGSDQWKRHRRRTQRLEPLRVAGRFTTVDGTLYDQMFPAKHAEPDKPTDLAPLLLAWMLIVDD